MSKVVELYKTLQSKIDADPVVKHELTIALGKVLNKVWNHALNSEDGFCYKFNIPSSEVLKIYQILDIDQEVARQSFGQDWQFPDHAYMYNDPYYIILLLLTYYGLIENDKKLCNDAFLLLMMRIWNGRKERYLKYCDPDIMKYVTRTYMTKRHLLTQHDSPLELLQKYFVPDLLRKYGPETVQSPERLKNLFMQSWARVDQLFVQNRIIDRTTGKSMGTRGILPLYKRAKDGGNKISSSTINTPKEDQTFDDFGSTSVHDEITKMVSDYITLNPNPKYADTFISTINDFTHVSRKLILQMLNAMHNHKYYDTVHDVVTLILSRLNISDKSDVCNVQFITNVKKQIISSKNNVNVRKLQEVLNILTKDILQDTANINYDNYSNVQKMQIRNVIIYGVVLNMRKAVCNVQSL